MNVQEAAESVIEACKASIRADTQKLLLLKAEVTMMRMELEQLKKEYATTLKKRKCSENILAGYKRQRKV